MNQRDRVTGRTNGSSLAGKTQRNRSSRGRASFAGSVRACHLARARHASFFSYFQRIAYTVGLITFTRGRSPVKRQSYRPGRRFFSSIELLPVGARVELLTALCARVYRGIVATTVVPIYSGKRD